jgi:alpha-glucosidase (family GH31 glycosyl hydrolase)
MSSIMTVVIPGKLTSFSYEVLLTFTGRCTSTFPVWLRAYARLISSYYAHIYNKLVFEAIKSKTGPDSAALFARSATAGGQQFPVHWGGDCESTFEAMAETIRGGLSLTSSGFAFWSHDIGGFEGLPREAVYCRWVALGLWSSHVCHPLLVEDES